MVTFDVIRDKQQATTYFATELSTYYGNARIGGKLVDVLGIKNQPLDEVFNSILTNYHPVNGEKLRPNKSKRLLFSFCISAPKPFSILAVYADDTRLFNIHAKATNEAISFIETFAEVRKRKDKQKHSSKTGQTLYFACDHMLSRCNDPQIHTHVNFFNLTWDGDEKGFRALDPGTMGKVTIVATQIYRNVLVRELNKIGIAAKITPNGELKIDEISDELCTKYSKRKHEIDKIQAGYMTNNPGRTCGNGFRAKVANKHKDHKCTPAEEQMYINKFRAEIEYNNDDIALNKVISNRPKSTSKIWARFRFKKEETSQDIATKIIVKVDGRVPSTHKYEYWKSAIIEAKGKVDYKDLFTAKKQIEGNKTQHKSKILPTNNTKVETVQHKEKQVTDEEWYRMERIRKEKEYEAYQEQQFYERQEERRLKKKKEEQERNINAPKIDDDHDINPPTNKSFDR